MLIDIITLSVFCLLFLAVVFLTRTVVERCRVADPPEWQAGNHRTNGSGQPKRRWKILEGLSAPLAAQIPQISADASRLDQDLKRAGYYRPTARRVFLAIRNLLFLTAVIATGALAVYADPANPDLSAGILIAGLAISVFLFGVPRLVVHLKAKRRVARIQSGLPDALDMISMCVTGGLSLQAALERVSREIRLSHPDLAMELEIIRQQAEVGSLEHALRQFSQRIDVAELKSMTALITQSERLGTNVVKALQDFADGVRNVRQQRAEEKANKKRVKILFPLVLCMAPSVFLLLWGPALVELRSFLVAQNRTGGMLAQTFDDMQEDRQENLEVIEITGDGFPTAP